MKPDLVIGLGNPLMGDDGIGRLVAERLANDPRLPESVEVIPGGPDLLRYAQHIEGRSRVFVIDAIQDDVAPGTISVFADGTGELESRQEHAHHLSAVQAIELLRLTTRASFVLVSISIPSAAVVPAASAAVASRMPAILARVIEELGHGRPL